MKIGKTVRIMRNFCKKQLIKLFAFSAILLWFGGCQLEEELLGVPGPDVVQNEDDLEVQLRGIYAQLNPYPFKLGIYMMLNTDDCHFINAAASQTVVQANRQFDANWLRNQLLWQGLYQLIAASNVYIETAEGLTESVDEAFVRRTVGEARFLRALSYFYAVRIYGGVPIRTKAFTLDDEQNLPRASVDSVYRLIFDDFTAASEVLLSKGQVDRGRATKGAAQGMLAMAYLTYGNYLDREGTGDKLAYYQLAKDYADSVIQSNEYTLVEDYADLWDVSQEESNYDKEVIYGIQYTRDPTNNAENSLGSRFARDYSPPNNSGYTSNAVGWYAVQPYFYDQYTTGEYEGDYRVEVSFATSWTNQANGNQFVSYPNPVPVGTGASRQPFLAKYKDIGAQQYNNENDSYVLRLSEIYLIYAEAENELNGPTAAAYDAFNQLRIRARKANGTPSLAPTDLTEGLTQEEFRMAILKERGLEFIGEDCKRHFDLVRMKAPDGRPMYLYIVDEVLPNIPDGRPVWNNQAREWRGGRKDNGLFEGFTERILTLPIPMAELNANPNFGPQNPGW